MYDKITDYFACMIRIDFPEPPLRTRAGEGGRMEVFDPVRRLWVRLTPEEWVRQNMLHWMVSVKGYPLSLIAVEKAIRLGGLTNKFDILVYDASHSPWLLVECKAMDVPMTEKVLMQALRYRMAVPAGVLVLTNGIETHALSLCDGRAEWLDEWPSRR
jgi:hypothetical protein